MRKIIKYIVSSILGIFWILLSLSPFTQELPGNYFKINDKVGAKCGKVIAIQSPNAISNLKHSSTVYVRNEMMIDFDETGLQSREVNFITFSKFNVGDRICFEKTLRDVRPQWYHIVWTLLSAGVAFFNFMGAITVMVFFFYWLYTGGTWKEFIKWY